MAPPIGSPVLLLLLLASSVVSSAAGRVAREVFPLDGDVAWVVQVSDLHLSAYHPERGEDVARLLAPALRAIRPALLLVTGDITDAKNRKRTSTRQDESEWIQYRNIVDRMVRHTGMDKRRIFDIRGNHDKYGVPYSGSNLDFFSIHSVSSQFSRVSNIQSISLVGNYRKYLFLGIDDTIDIGIRGPSNLFGHPTDEMIDTVESELQYWDIGHPDASLVTKVVFGHFPMSFIASTENGMRYESVFAKQSVSAYICGHLHAKLSKQLWRLHTIAPKESDDSMELDRMKKQFWEWEVGDWKESRLVRILAIDAGDISFLDVELPAKQDDFPTTILITYPTDSRSMNLPRGQPIRNDINALVFSSQPILNVTAKVFDSSRDFRIVEEVPLQLADTNSYAHNNKQPVFHAKWNAENYISGTSAARYWLQVLVVDSRGNETASVLRPFSVEGKQETEEYPSTWLACLFFMVRWEDLYLFLLWSNICFLVMLLSLPVLLNQCMERSASYQKWAASVSISTPFPQRRRILFLVLWFLIEGSRSGSLWSAMVIYLLYLLKFPWFWGCMTTEDGDIFPMYMFGWRVDSPGIDELNGTVWGYPDIMTITLPFMYLVVAPLVLLIYCLFAERSATCLHSSIRKSVDPDSETLQFKPSEVKFAPSSSLLHAGSGDKLLCRGWRRFLLLACLVVACIHLRHCWVFMGYYGVGAVALSPALAWAPAFLLAAAIYSSGKA